MKKPIDYLTEETYRPEWLQDGVTESTIQAVLAQKQEITKIGKELAKATRYYLIGSGGSFSVQFPIRYIAEKDTTVPVYNFSSWDFLERRPKGVDKDAVCVFISQSGRTKEVVQALDWCKGKGATVFGLTQRKDSVINSKADYGFGWDGRGVTLGKLSTLYLLFGVIFSEKGYSIGMEMVEAVESLQALLPSMVNKAKESAKVQGLELKDYDEIFVLGGGINWGLAYQFGVCTLMEMCWVHATSVNYSEFRHGPLEMFTPGTVALFLRGRSGERVLEDAIIGFCMGNSVGCYVYDSQNLDVGNLLTPFTLFIELEWLSYYLSLAKNRNMEAWRYYDKGKF